MKPILALVILCVSAVAQDGPNTSQTAGPPVRAATSLLFYDGSGNVIYRCRAWSTQNTSTFARSDSSLTSIVVLTNVGTVTTAAAHGLQVNNSITISGATVDTDLNGTYVIATVPSTTTFTIATASVANATYTESTLQFTTRAPRTSAPIWEIDKFTVTGSNTTAIQSSGGVSTLNAICDNRAVTTGSTKIGFQ